MIVGIDASNIRAGGGITHIKELLNNADPATFGINEIIIWAPEATLDQLPEKNWLKKSKQNLLNRSLPFRLYWQKFKLTTIARSSCDILFTPGANYAGNFQPYVSMSQNMLVFEQKERARYGMSWMQFRLKLLSLSQGKSLKKASGIVYISNYAKNFINNILDTTGRPQTVIYHGIADRFSQQSKPQTISFSKERPFRLLYISIIDVYKHQWAVVSAVNSLREKGMHINLELIGPAYPQSLAKLKPHLNENVKYLEKIPFEEISEKYKSADGFIFASTCENMPNILVEAMTAGLPIACSNYGPMPEILQDAGIYFDPLDLESTMNAVEELYNNVEKRQFIAEKAYSLSKQFSWEKCATDTFAFIAEVAKGHKN